ncbi:MAG: glycosyltransferase family 4 protein [Ktedonobacteraceae bacterium]
MLKSVTPALNAVGEKTVTAKVPIKICMHILRDARNDVRSLRSGAALAREGFEVSIIDVEHDRSRPIQEDLCGIHLRHLIIPTWHSSRRSELRFFITSLRTFMLSSACLIQSRADIYHATELNALPACFIAAILCRKPLVYEAYELHIPYPETSVAFWRGCGKLIMRLLTIVLPRCAGVIATTPLYAEEMKKRFRLKEVTLLRNIPPYRIVEQNDLLREHLSLGAEKRIALYQGRLQRNRGIDKIIHAAAYLEPDTVIVMIGDGPDKAYQASIRSLIASEGVADRVKIMPPIPLYEELLDWTVSADIGLILYTPGYSLAVKLILPNKLFEYIMAGVPVLATQLDAVEEVMQKYDVGQIVSSIEPAAIGAAINAMLTDKGTLARLKQNALNAARHDLNWEKESLQVVRLYRDVAAKLKLR